MCPSFQRDPSFDKDSIEPPFYETQDGSEWEK